jgi:hypothetical protein
MAKCELLGKGGNQVRVRRPSSERLSTSIHVGVWGEYVWMNR